MKSQSVNIGIAGLGTVGIGVINCNAETECYRLKLDMKDVA